MSRIGECKRNTSETQIEVSINLEESKSGVPYPEIEAFIKELIKYKNINIKGLMMMAIKDSNKESLLNQFNKLVALRNQIEKNLNISLPGLSMGMSNDYKEAIKCGTTTIRLGKILYKE